ncbi:MAG: dihydrolipoamide acetyltransferase family protein [Mycoplasmoidaceae bacterium]
MNQKNIFRFTDIGEGLHEGTIQEIKVKVGAKVNEGDSLLSVQTDKVASDLPCPSNGVILKIYIKEGQLVHVGDPLMYIGEPGEKLDESSVVETQVAQPSSFNQISNQPKEEDKKEQASSEGSSVVGQVTVSNKLMGKIGNQGEELQNNQATGYNNLSATPLARKIANELRINLSQISGSGPNGRVVYDDVLLFKRNRLANEINSFTDKLKKETHVAVTMKDIDHSSDVTPIRKQIANSMTRSHVNIPNTMLVFEVDVTELVKFRSREKDSFKIKNGVNLTYLSFFIQVISLALKQFPIFNAVYDEINEKIIYRGEINMGFAVDTPDGLLVPNIKNVDHLSLHDIAKEVVRLSKSARDKKLSVNEIQGGTYTITNLGSTGAMYGLPIIFYPQLSIFGLGGIEKKLYLDKDGKVASKDIMYISVSADHRWIDGADIGRFAKFIKDQIELKFYERNF